MELRRAWQGRRGAAELGPSELSVRPVPFNLFRSEIIACRTALQRALAGADQPFGSGAVKGLPSIGGGSPCGITRQQRATPERMRQRHVSGPLPWPCYGIRYGLLADLKVMPYEVWCVPLSFSSAPAGSSFRVATPPPGRPDSVGCVRCIPRPGTTPRLLGPANWPHRTGLRPTAMSFSPVPIGCRSKRRMWRAGVLHSATIEASRPGDAEWCVSRPSQSHTSFIKAGRPWEWSMPYTDEAMVRPWLAGVRELVYADSFR